MILLSVLLAAQSFGFIACSLRSSAHYACASLAAAATDAPFLFAAAD